jgi:nicotinamide mononucleotide transporter
VTELAADFARALAATTPLEWLGAALGLAYLVLAIRQHPACWIAAFASTAIYLYVFGRAGLYMQAALQVYFLAMAVYGWYAWRGTRARPELRVTRAAWSLQAGGLAAVALATVASATWLAQGSGAAQPWLDSATSWGSVFATWLVARKKLDSWVWWLAIDALIVVLCWQQRLYPTALLYALYLVLVVIGWREWRRSMARAADGVAGARA